MLLSCKVANNIKVLPIIESSDLVKYYRNASQFVVKVLDGNGGSIVSGKVRFNVNGVFYERNINASGLAKLNINLAPGDYVITSEYNGCKVANNHEIS